MDIEIAATARQFLGMPPARFLRDYWQKRPLLVRGAFPRFVAPLTPEDLAGLACEEAALSRLVRHERARDTWSVRQGPFAESEFPALPRQDWTLLVQDVDKWDPDVAALLHHFAFLPRWRIDDVMVSFAAPGGSVGAHVDQYDVFLLQGLGRRRWQIEWPERACDASRVPREPEFRDDSELKLLRRFDPTHDWVLEPGDMLYLPPGVPHHGVALDACLTFSVGMRAPSRAELLVDFAEFLAEQLPESQRYCDPELAPAKDDGEIDAAALGRVRAALGAVGMRVADAADGEGNEHHADAGSPGRAGRTGGFAQTVPAASLRTWFGCFITRYRSAGEVMAPPRAASPAQVEARLRAGALLHRHPFARFAWARAGRSAELYVDGRCLPCPPATARRLCRPQPLAAADLARLGEGGRAVVHDLVRTGAFLLSRRPSRGRA